MKMKLSEDYCKALIIYNVSIICNDISAGQIPAFRHQVYLKIEITINISVDLVVNDNLFI